MKKTTNYEFFGISLTNYDKKNLPKIFKNVPEILLKEYYKKIINLEELNNKIKKTTDDWIENQKELIELEETMKKLIN